MLCHTLFIFILDTKKELKNMIHILDARNTIHKILQDTKDNIYRINKDYKGNITRFHLGIIFIGTNSMYQKFSYIQGKICEFMNVKLTVVHLHSYISKKDILEQIDNLNKDDTITGILIYSLPSSTAYKTDYVDDTYNIDTEKNKDVDSITSRLSDIKYSLSNTLSEPDIYRTQVKDSYIRKILDGAYQLMKYTEEYNKKIKIKTLIQQYENEELFQKRLNLEKSFIHDEIIKCMEEKWNQITDEELLPRVKHGNFPKARKEYIDENLNEILLKSIFSCIVPLEIILPKRLQEDRNEIVEEIQVEKDVSGSTSSSLGKISIQKYQMLPCIAEGIIRVLEDNEIELDKKIVTIVGKEKSFGKQLANLFMDKGCIVIICHSHTENLREYTKQADILIVDVGISNFMTKEYIKEGSIVIDKGLYGLNNKLIGDINFQSMLEMEEVTYLSTVSGLRAIGEAILFENILKAYLIQS